MPSGCPSEPRASSTTFQVSGEISDSSCSLCSVGDGFPWAQQEAFCTWAEFCGLCRWRPDSTFSSITSTETWVEKSGFSAVGRELWWLARKLEFQDPFLERGLQAWDKVLFLCSIGLSLPGFASEAPLPLTGGDQEPGAIILQVILHSSETPYIPLLQPTQSLQVQVTDTTESLLGGVRT